MTVSSLWPVHCPVCGQPAKLLYRPDTDNWKLFIHNNAEGKKCQNSETIYPNTDATTAFGGKQ